MTSNGKCLPRQGRSSGSAEPRSGSASIRDNAGAECVRPPPGDHAAHEAERLLRLHSYEILYTPAEEAFDRITRLASRILEAPVSLVSLVDTERQWFKSRVGLDVEETPRDVAFCGHAIRDSCVLVVEDATTDDRFKTNPLVTGDPKIRFYAGAPLTTEDGYRIGTLCVIDFSPRTLSKEDRGMLEDLAKIVIDELELRRVAALAKAARTYLLEAIDALPDGFVLYDTYDRFVLCNQKYREIYAESSDMMVPGAFFEHIIRQGVARGQYPDALGREEDWIRERLEQHREPQGSIEQRLPNGNWLRIEERRTTDGGFVGFRIDITELKERERKLEQLATTDELTGLPNRCHFHDQLSLALANAKRTNHLVGLMFLDLDRFKHVNDSLGHGVGDELLNGVAERLESCCRETDVVARLGGDEFAVIVTNIDDVGGVTLLADRIIEALQTPFDIKRHKIQSGTSVGIAIYPDDVGNIEELMRNADLALYRAKELGRGCWRLYDEEMQAQAQHRTSIERDLRKAIDNGELVLHFQPQVDVAAGRVVGAESLLRWHHPELGLVAPDEFVPIAERSRLIVPIGDYVLREACRQNRAWQDAGLPLIVSAVNISPIEFRNPIS